MLAAKKYNGVELDPQINGTTVLQNGTAARQECNGDTPTLRTNITNNIIEPVIIIGAGIGGLCLAQGLQKAGRDFLVLERDASLHDRPQGYRLKIERNGAQALKSALTETCFQKFEATCAITTCGQTDYNPLNGQITKSRAGSGLAGQQGLAATYTVDRGVFRSILTTGISDKITFDKELLSYDVINEGRSILATFKDGSQIRGSFLVGADGIRSSVRRKMLPKMKYVDTGAMCIYGKTPITPSLEAEVPPKALRWMTTFVDSAPLIQSVLIGDSPLTLISEPIRWSSGSRALGQMPMDYVYWAMVGRRELFTDSKSTKAYSASEASKLSLEVTKEWHDSMNALMRLQDTEQCSAVPVVSAIPEIPTWQPSERVTLLGDAIHAMSPCGGVGANTALVDAAELVKLFGDPKRTGPSGIDPTSVSIGNYEASMRERARAMIMRSFVGSKKLFDQRPFEECPAVEWSPKAILSTIMHTRNEDTSLYELIATLACNVGEVNSHLRKHNLPGLSYGESHPTLPENADFASYGESRAAAIEAAEKILYTLRGPREVLLDISFQHCASASLQVIQHYEIAHHIPLQGTTTYAKVAESVGKGIESSLVQRVVQHAITYGLFQENAAGEVGHNNTSALLVKDPDLEAWLYLCTNVAYPAGAQIPRALELYGASSEADETAYSVSIGRKISQFQRFREPDGKALYSMFGKAMKGISAGGASGISHVVDGYPWHQFSTTTDHLIVDVGGGMGHVAIELAKTHDTLRFEVQDLPETVESAEKQCPPEFRDRIDFRAHNFLEQQPDHKAASITYFARFILHDWSDKYASQILEALAKSMRPQDRLIVNEVVIPELGTLPRGVERRLHDRDLLMLMNLNGRERTLSVWKQLFDSITPTLQLRKIYRPTDGELSLIELSLSDGQGQLNGSH
ncbi:6-hydroxytryprostatin B O-methyltransferase [Cercospora beticola]|uniref:6-hydroxytryprostatin B O-methyltransferase n=2 Tax=Cercospora beticola TaxID=122368 RepID=A0A2G5HD19_CERBT|nr:6-hydroxytryprostatin B O-methyltransferase [Cercospora beticola]PIA90440.1 6-hydroxytryprostatin B O-methyltransferase [Cercospora beticola]